MDNHITISEPLIPSQEHVRRQTTKKCQVVALVMVLASILALAIGLAIPGRQFEHGTRLLRATHVVNATHIIPATVHVANLSSLYIQHDEHSPKVMHLAEDAEEQQQEGEQSDVHTQALLRAKYTVRPKRRPVVFRGEQQPDGVQVGDEKDEQDDISLPTVLAYARMASSTYDYDHGTFDGSTGDGAHGDGQGYGHARNNDQSHVKAVVYESGTYSCWWWCKFVPDSRGSSPSSATNVIVAFKGTSKIGWTMRSDFLTDADMFVYSIANNKTISDAVVNGPHVRRYWLESEAIVNAVQTVLYPPGSVQNMQLSFTGHSLGGVLAGLHAVKNNVLGVGFNSPSGSKVAEIVGVNISTGDSKNARSSFCTYNIANDVLSDHSPPDVIPLLMANRGGLDLLFLGSQVTRAVAYLNSGDYTAQTQLGRVASMQVSPKVTDPEELHSIVTIIDLLEEFKKGKGDPVGSLRCA